MKWKEPQERQKQCESTKKNRTRCPQKGLELPATNKDDLISFSKSHLSDKPSVLPPLDEPSAGKDRLVLDLSCRRTPMTQKALFTLSPIDGKLMLI